MFDIEAYAQKRGISEHMIAEAQAELHAEIEAYNLAQARKRRDMTQQQVADRMGVSQKRISELERGDLGSVQWGTLRRYIESIGGRLVGLAEFPEGTIELS